MRPVVVFSLALILVACSSPDPEPAVETQPRVSRAKNSPVEAKLDPTWTDDALAIAKAYEDWGRVDDQARWAPWLCRMPAPPAARFSRSDDAQTHGEKLYTLYAADPYTYTGEGREGFMGMKPRIGATEPLPNWKQVLVKEAWLPERIDASETEGRTFPLRTWGKSELAPVEKDGVLYGADEVRGLYLMFQVTDRTRGETDEGWVYATLAPKAGGWEVTSAGTVASCMDCHVNADGEGGRLFGLPR